VQFERLDALADRRGGDVQRPRSGLEGPAVDDRDERRELIRVYEAMLMDP